MNILFVDQFGELGGAQQCLLELIPAVQARGWNAFAAVPPQGPLRTRLETAGVQVQSLAVANYTRGAKGPGDAARFLCNTPTLAWQLHRLLRQNAIDLLHVNGPRLLPAAALLPRQVPIFFHAHSVPTSHARHLVRAAAARPHITSVAVSKFVAQFLPRAKVIPNGVADLLRPRVANAVPHIGILGRIAPEKGHSLLLAAARLIPNARFVVCGSGGEYESRIRRQAAGLPVDFLGWRDDIAAVLAGLDLLVVPSASGEAFGRVVIEAFSAQVPVVAFASGGIPELIEDGHSGYLVRSFTPESLAAGIETALKNDAKRARIAQNGRQNWQLRYTLHHYTDAIIAELDRAAR